MHTIVSEIVHLTTGYKLLKYKSSTDRKRIEKTRLMYVNKNSKHHFVSSLLYRARDIADICTVLLQVSF